MNYQKFYDHFTAGQATTSKQKNQCHRVRYDVYCEQQGLLTTVNKERLERDGLDAQANHNLICYTSTQTAVATSRLLFDDMPIYTYVDNALLPQKEHCVELSRYCVDHVKMGSIIESIKTLNPELGLKLKRLGVLVLSSALMKLNMAKCLNEGRPYLLGITEQRLIKKMNILGLTMEPIGPEVEYLGTRQPFLFSIEKTFDQMKKRNTDLWCFLTNKGELHDQAKDLSKKLNLH